MNDGFDQGKKTSSTRTKTIVLIIVGIIFIGLAILVWANQTGKISLWASTTSWYPENAPAPFNVASIVTQEDVLSTIKTQDTITLKDYSMCAPGSQFNVYTWDASLDKSLKSVGSYPVTNNPMIVNYATKQTNPRYYIIKCKSLGDVMIAAGGSSDGSSTPTSTSTATTTSTSTASPSSASCTTSSTDSNVCINAFPITVTSNCSGSDDSIAWSLGANPANTYSVVTIQVKDETSGGSYTVTNPKIEQTAVSDLISSNICSSSTGQCTFNNTVSDNTHVYAYRVYAKNISDGKWYRSSEAYSTSCGGGSSDSITLNSISSTCTTSNLTTVGKQINALSWSKATGIYGYEPMVKSEATNGQYVQVAGIYNLDTTTYDHAYPSYSDVFYEIVANNPTATSFASNEVQAISQDCPVGTTPTSQPTPTSDSDVTLSSVSCSTNDDGTQDLTFNLSTTKSGNLDITAALESTYTTGPSTVIGQKYWQSLWTSGLTGSQVSGDSSTKTFTVTNIGSNWGSKTYPETWRVMLWPSDNPDDISYSNNITLASCDATSTPTAPTNLTAQATSSTEIKLNWTGTLASGEGFYSVYSSSGQLIKNVDSSITELTVTGLSCETEYGYYVTASIGTVESDASNTATATTGTCGTGNDISNLKPENINLEYLGSGLAALSWDAVDGATGYDIYNCSGEYIVSTSQTSYNFTGNSCGKTLCYYIIAHNDSSSSQPSDQASADTESCSSGGGSSSGSTTSVTSLVSTGSSLWFNILIALLLVLGIGYFMFRKQIHKE